jgi:hypothetical protein
MPRQTECNMLESFFRPDQILYAILAISKFRPLIEPWPDELPKTQ